MLALKKINYFVILQVILFNVALFLTAQVILRQLSFVFFQSILHNQNTLSTMSLAFYSLGLPIISQCIYFAVTLIAYYIVIRFFEKNKEYQPLLTGQPIVLPLIKGFILMVGIQGITIAATFFIDKLELLPTPAFSSEILYVLVLGFIFRFVSALPQELVLRGYSITRLEREIGGHGAVWLSALMFVGAHLLFSVIPLIPSLLYALLFGYVFLITRSIYVTTGMNMASAFLVSFILSIGFIDVGTSHFSVIHTVCIFVATIIAACWYHRMSEEKEQRTYL